MIIFYIIITFALTAILFYHIGKHTIKYKLDKELNYRVGIFKPKLTWKNVPIDVIVEVRELYITRQKLCKVKILDLSIINNPLLNANNNAKSELKSYIGEYFNESEIEWYDNLNKDRKVKIHKVLNG